MTQTIGDQLPINLIEEYGEIGYRVFILGLQSKSISTGICVFQMPLWCLLKCIADKPSKHSILFWFSIINFLKNKYLRRSSDFLRSTQNFVQSSSCFVNLLSKPQNHEEIFFKFCVLLRKSKLYFSDNKMDPNEKVYLVKVGLNFIGIITFFKNIKILFKDVRFWKKSLSFDFPSSKLCDRIFIALLKKSNVPF